MTENLIEKSPVQVVEPAIHGIPIHIKRDDLLHPVYGGNKWRKLKYNLAFMRESGIGEMVTFGGPFSNHIHAVAGVVKDLDIQAIAYIRGEIDDLQNPVLSFARASGVQLVPLSRTEFARRNKPDFIAGLKSMHPRAHLIPEGGTNRLALKGCAEIVDEVESELGYLPQHWIVPGGTGGTAAGIAQGLAGRATLHVITALKKGLFTDTYMQALQWGPQADRSRIIVDDRFHFGGLAKWDAHLIDCMRRVEMEHGLSLDPVYTGKAWFAMEAMLQSREIHRDASILFLHTGGQAGRQSFNYRFGDLI